MIKAIFFDFDGVLTTDKTGSLTTARYLSERTGIGFDRIHDAFKPFNTELILGRISHEEMWSELCAKLNREIEIDLLKRAFESTPINDGMLRLAARLKQGYSVGIITDNKKDRIDHLKVHCNLASLFDPIVVSAEVGSDKRTSGIFEIALNSLGLNPAQSIFIDNNRDNLIVADALGINTIYFDDQSNDIAGLIATLGGKYRISILGEKC